MPVFAVENAVAAESVPGTIFVAVPLRQGVMIGRRFR